MMPRSPRVTKPTGEPPETGLSAYGDGADIVSFVGSAE